MKKLKILQVGIDSHLGGIETYLLNVARHIDRDVFQMDFLSYHGETPCFLNDLLELGCGFRFIRSRRQNPIGNIVDLRRLYAAENYDIVQCNANSMSYVTPAIEAVKMGIGVLFLSHNAGASAGSSSSILNCINRIRFPFDKVVLAAVSDIAGKWMFGESRTFIIQNNGVDTKKYGFSSQKRCAARLEMGISTDREVILHVGAFRTQKNHGFLIDVFNEYLTHSPSALLLLVGEGELKDEIVGKVNALGIQGNVMFAGLRNDVDCVMSASDKFLFPSLYEGFPISLIEAEANGLFCVVSDAITEEVCFDNCMRISLDSSVDVWSNALKGNYIGDRGDAFRRINHEGLGIDAAVGRLEELYWKIKGVAKEGA